MKRFVLLQMIAVLVLIDANVLGDSGDDNWPTWRGPNLSGISPNGNPPLTWSETENVKWKFMLTGDASNSSPIIWKDKIFFQTAVKTDVQGKPEAPGESSESRGGRGPGGSPPTNVYKFNLVCLDRDSGKLLWEKNVCQAKPHQGHHNDHGFASFSPVTDGGLVWAAYGSRGIYCYDMDGNKVWGKELPQMKTMFGEGGSPSLAGNAVIVMSDQQDDSFIFAFEKKTGELLWKKTRDEPTSYSTPMPVTVDGKLQVIVNATNFIRSYDVQTGDVIWQCSGQTRNVIPTPVIGFETVYCTSGFRGNALQAIKLGGKGDLSGSDSVIWQVNEATTPYVPSPLLYQGRIYVCASNNEVLTCYDAKTGEPHFVKQTMNEMKGIYASPAAAGGRIYFLGRNGVSYVLKPSDKFEVLAVNTLNDNIDCSPAFAGDEMFIKGKKTLYCLRISNSK